VTSFQRGIAVQGPSKIWHWVAVFLIAGVAAPACADVTVFAAASLKEALDAQVRIFQRDTAERVTVAYGASTALARQIEAGAPADLFIAADAESMDYVDGHGLVDHRSRVILLKNRLALIAPANSAANLPIVPGFALAAALGDGKLAMGNPGSVPAGKYAKRALQSLAVWESVEKHVARTENVRAALALVARGEAPLGIVYTTDARAEPRVRVLGLFPESSHPPIVYPVAVVAGRKSPRAQALLNYLASDAARSIWQSHGFALDR
jgi:molybdate transport system substrate-binding protein